MWGLIFFSCLNSWLKTKVPFLSSIFVILLLGYYFLDTINISFVSVKTESICAYVKNSIDYLV